MGVQTIPNVTKADRAHSRAAAPGVVAAARRLRSGAKTFARPVRIRTHEKQSAPRPQLQTRRALALTTLDLIARTLRATKTVPLAMRKIARAVSPSVLPDAPV